MEASITLKKVGKLVKDKTILASLTFGIERGSLVAIIGDNEAGKSMLLKGYFWALNIKNMDKSLLMG